MSTDLARPPFDRQTVLRAAAVVRRFVPDPAERLEVLEALGLAPYSDPRAAGYRALARALAEPDP